MGVMKECSGFHGTVCMCCLRVTESLVCVCLCLCVWFARLVCLCSPDFHSSVVSLYWRDFPLGPGVRVCEFGGRVLVCVVSGNV